MISTYVWFLALPAVVLSQCTNCNYGTNQYASSSSSSQAYQSQDGNMNEPGYLPDYQGDKYTDPQRIKDTQALNKAFFDSIGGAPPAPPLTPAQQGMDGGNGGNVGQSYNPTPVNTGYTNTNTNTNNNYNANFGYSQPNTGYNTASNTNNAYPYQANPQQPQYDYTSQNQNQLLSSGSYQQQQQQPQLQQQQYNSQYCCNTYGRRRRSAPLFEFMKRHPTIYSF